MTANKLADEAMEHYKAEAPRGFNVNWMKEVATMLRQQAKEIGMLKQIIDANNLQSNIGQFIRPIDEPVAHRFKWEEQEKWQYGDGYDATGAPNDPDYFAYEPLYTNPQKYCPSENNEAYEKGFIDGMDKQRDSRVQQMVEGYAQLRELTDEEISQVYKEVSEPFGKKRLYEIHDFARAILKKASEK